MMRSVLRMPLAMAFVIAVLALLAHPRASNASTTLSFDYTTGVPQTIATITGTSGTLNFNLDIGDPTASNVYGNFGMDVYGPGSVLLGAISLDLGPIFTGPGPNDYGDISGGVNGDLTNVSLWNLTVNSGGLPLTLVVTSSLDTFDAPFTPVLTLDLTGDLQVAPSATPLPGTLALFAGGAGLFGWFGSRRRRASARS